MRILLAAAFWLLLALPGNALAADTDRDGDGLRDSWERRYALTDPAMADSDGDGLIDAEEDLDDDELSARAEQRFGTDPADADSDDDGLPDGQEDHDDDGRPNALEQHQRPVPADVQPSLEAARDDISSHAPRCGVRTGRVAVNICHFGDLEGDRTVALVGDSKATMYLPPAIRAAKAEGWHLVTMLKGRCTPILGTMPRNQRQLDGGASCIRWRYGVLGQLRRSPPDLIVLVFSDDYALLDHRGRKLAPAQSLRAMRAGVARTIASMPGRSTVVLLADSPNNTHNPVACLRRYASDMSACVTVRTPPQARAMDEAIAQSVIEAGGEYRTLRDQICPYEPCPLVLDGRLVYRDKGHLTVTFTRTLAPALRALLAPLMAEEVGPAEPADDEGPGIDATPGVTGNETNASGPPERTRPAEPSPAARGAAPAEDEGAA